jgi:Leucine-rich repeat (LRR) protein
LSDLGQGSLGCIGAIKSVDLSHNRLSIVSANQMSSWSGLEELRLNDNNIKSVQGNVFKACSGSLKFVDMSNNELSSLPESLLSEAAMLKRIGLSNNSLSDLPSALFRSQSQSLEVLDLSGNLLTTLQAPLLSNLPLLASLDLSYNEISSIESPAALRGLLTLQTLKLGNNKLVRLPNFPALPSLRYLVLSHNSLSRLNNRLLFKVPALSHLLLDSNHIEELAEKFFSNSTHLTVLDLSGNLMSGEIPEAVNALGSLQSFAIGDNRIDNLSQLRLPALWRLQASGNRLKNVSAVQLGGLPALQVLDLSRNMIRSIEKSAFVANKPLQAIRLDGNRDGIHQIIL